MRRRGSFIGTQRGATPHWPGRPADAQLDEDALERTEAGKCGLEHVEPDEGRKEKPALIHEISERETGEHERAGDEEDEALNGHMMVRFGVGF